MFTPRLHRSVGWRLDQAETRNHYRRCQFQHARDMMLDSLLHLSSPHRRRHQPLFGGAGRPCSSRQPYILESSVASLVRERQGTAFLRHTYSTESQVAIGASTVVNPTTITTVTESFLLGIPMVKIPCGERFCREVRTPTLMCGFCLRLHPRPAPARFFAILPVRRPAPWTVRPQKLQVPLSWRWRCRSGKAVWRRRRRGRRLTMSDHKARNAR